MTNYNTLNSTLPQEGEEIITNFNAISVTLAAGYEVGFAMGLIFINSIVEYIKEKPLGTQSILDIALRLYFTIKQLGCIYTMIAGPTFLLTEDAGHILAELLMWPGLILVTLGHLHNAVIPLIQILVINSPSLELAISDDLAYWILTIIVISPFILLIAICHPLGIYPPGYYILRRQEVQYHWFGVVRTTIFVITTIIFIIIKITISKLTPFSNSNELIGSKIVIGLLSSMFVCSVVFIQILSMSSSILFLPPLIAFIIFPSAVIFSNDNLREHFVRKHPIIGNIFDLKYCQRFQSRVAPSEMELEIVQSSQ